MTQHTLTDLESFCTIAAIPQGFEPTQEELQEKVNTYLAKAAAAPELLEALEKAECLIEVLADELGESAEKYPDFALIKTRINKVKGV